MPNCNCADIFEMLTLQCLQWIFRFVMLMDEEEISQGDLNESNWTQCLGEMRHFVNSPAMFYKPLPKCNCYCFKKIV